MIRIVGASSFSCVSMEETGEYEDTEAPNVGNRSPSHSGGEAETLPSGFEGWEFWDEGEIEIEKRPLSKGIGEISGPQNGGRSILNAFLEEGRYDFDSCLEVLRTCVKGFATPIRSGLEGDKAYGVLGLYCQGGLKGVTRFARKNDLLTRYLNGFVGQHYPNGSWVTLYLSSNTDMMVHRDSRNLQDRPSWIVALGDFQGGGLWVGSGSDQGPVLKRLPDGRLAAGLVLDIHNNPQTFDSCKWHETQAWLGNDRWVLVAYTPKGFEGAIEGCKPELESLGFPVDSLREVGKGDHDSPKEFGPSIGKFNPDSVSLADEGKFKESWEVLFPVEVWDEGTHASRVELHQEAVDFCLRTLRDLQEAQAPTLAAKLAELVSIARSNCEYQEAVLEMMHPQPEREVSLRALSQDVPLSTCDPTPEEIFLQTRTIALDAARRELDKWRGPGEEEITALEQTTGAVIRVTTDQVEEWIRAGENVIQLPGKVALTRKAGAGRRRLRAVVCGNHLPSDALGLSKGDLFANGVEALTVRVALAYAATKEGWYGCVLDIKCAFLYAPARSPQQTGERVIVVHPPYFLVQLGLLQPCHRWRVGKALCGLQTSPRDWAVYRDGVLVALEISCDGVVLKLHQGVSDESLWFAKCPGGHVWAIAVVYVDDICLFGPQNVLEAIVKGIQEKWKTSSPCWTSSGHPVSLCGVELVQTTRGWRLSQLAYLSEILTRYNVNTTANVPLVRWDEPEPEDTTPEGVKEAQAITGALLWAVTRSRPDLMFAVAKMSQFCTKSPQRVVELGHQVLAYVKHTLDYGIDFLLHPGPAFGSHGQLATPRSPTVVELYSDRSHAPNGGRSTQCSMVLWLGACLLWECTRQSFTTLSSAESELVSLVHTVQVGESVQPIIEELLEQTTQLSLQGDNAASIRAFEPGSGGWRNRHLRMHAAAGRERVDAGSLIAQHISGEYQIADLGTKALGSSRIAFLLRLADVTRSDWSSVLSPGLTLVQRARLRRQLFKQEIVEAPILRMRFGGLPTWLQGPETELQGSRVQTWGSS